jgi:protocatechuate 3,4-dioxygenase beta subunit
MSSRLSSDLAALVSRRRALGLVGLGLGGMAAACNDSVVARAASADACLATPTEIRGPFPADGTNGGRATISVLGSEGLVRRDIRPSFAGMEGTADGIPLELELRVVAADGCTPLAGAAIYLWQCDALGDYSLYTVESVNYLRGLQQADSDGVVRFTSIIPGCYGGRAPHFHFEAFASLDAATHGRNSLLVSQIGFPTEDLRRAYADPRYGSSLVNLRRWPMERDWMFAGDSAEDVAWQTVKLSGDPGAGYRGEVSVGIG